MLAKTIELKGCIIVLSNWESTFREGDLFLPLVVSKSNFDAEDITDETGFNETIPLKEDKLVLTLIEKYLRHTISKTTDTSLGYINPFVKPPIASYMILSFCRMFRASPKMVGVLMDSLLPS